VAPIGKTHSVLRQPFESAQYCSIDYQAELRKHGILTSMSGKGNCYDNAMVETFFQDPEIRAGLADHLLHPPRSRPGHWPLH